MIPVPFPRTALAALALAAALLAAGCGGEQGGDGRSAATGPATSPERPSPGEQGSPGEEAPAPAGQAEGEDQPQSPEQAAGEAPPTTPGPNPPPEQPRPQLEGSRGCGDVAFTPQSDNGAFAIQATGVDCATARQVAAGAEDRRGGAYSAAGFSCRSTGTTGGPLPATRYRCEGGGGVVTFEAG